MVWRLDIGRRLASFADLSRQIDTQARDSKMPVSSMSLPLQIAHSELFEKGRRSSCPACVGKRGMAIASPSSKWTASRLPLRRRSSRESPHRRGAPHDLAAEYRPAPRGLGNGSPVLSRAHEKPGRYSGNPESTGSSRRSSDTQLLGRTERVVIPVLPGRSARRTGLLGVPDIRIRGKGLGYLDWPN